MRDPEEEYTTRYFTYTLATRLDRANSKNGHIWLARQLPKSAVTNQPGVAPAKSKAIAENLGRLELLSCDAEE